MKKILFTVLSFVVFNGLYAQENEKIPADTLPPIELQRQVFVYSMAKKYGDEDMAKAALYNILSHTPGNVSILDSLALMYFQKQNFAFGGHKGNCVAAIKPYQLRG